VHDCIFRNDRGDEDGRVQATLLSGLMAGTSPIAQAAMMGYATEAEHGHGMSQIVLLNCLALVRGPAAGGLLGHFDFRAPLLFALRLSAGAFASIRLAWKCAGAPEH
jgi:DHA1 family tetracycline resistance protein-like MFS transporter